MPPNTFIARKYYFCYLTDLSPGLSCVIADVADVLLVLVDFSCYIAVIYQDVAPVYPSLSQVFHPSREASARDRGCEGERGERRGV